MHDSKGLNRLRVRISLNTQCNISSELGLIPANQSQQDLRQLETSKAGWSFTLTKKY